MADSKHQDPARMQQKKKKFVFKSRQGKCEGTDILASIQRNQEEITKWLQERDRCSRIVLKDAMNRNIIFVGKCRSGKSTALEIMKTPLTFISLGSVFAQTIEACINHFTVEVEGEDDQKFNFNIGVIDSPGLFELREKGNMARDISTLEDIILKCMASEITKIHAIFFVVAYNGTVNKEDVESLKHFMKLFDGAQEHIHVLITKAEALGDNEKQKIEAEFRNAPGFQELLKDVGRILFTGAVQQSQFDNGFVDVVKHEMTNVEIMREELFETIFSCDTPFELNSIGMTDNVRNKATSLFKELTTLFAARPLQNPANFKEGCKRLNSWLPVVSMKEREEMKQFLAEASEHICQLEQQQQPVQDAAASAPQ